MDAHLSTFFLLDYIRHSIYYHHYCHLQEVSQFQNRLNRGMQDCQDKARDMMQPGYENDARKMAKVEESLIACMGVAVEDHIKLLKPMRERIIAQVKQQS
jgi:Eukaryotic protein of unknown function (DUF842)